MGSLFADIDLARRAKIDWQPSTTFPNLRDAREVVVDFETTGLRWWDGAKPVGLGVGIPNGPSWYLPFGHRGGNLSEEGVKAWVTDQLRDKDLIAHNAKFDNHIARTGWNVDFEKLGCRWRDTQHALALLDDHRYKFDLESVSKEFLGAEGKVKTTAFTNELIDPSRMGDYHGGEIEPYAREDINLTGRLWEFFKPQLTEQDLWRVMDLESRLIWAVAEMERNPCRLDMEKLLAWEKKSEQELHELLKEIHGATGVLLNTDSSNDWGRLFRARRLPEPTERTDKGKPSYAGDVLRAIADPIIQKGYRAKRLASLRSKYICAYIERSEGGYLRTSLHQLKADEGGAISGRFSSSTINDPKGQWSVGANLQQVFAVEKQQEIFGNDYIIRELFIPDEGKLWLSDDAEQIEYRLFAHYVNSKRINDVYAANPNAKFHDEVWAMLKQFKPDILYKQVKNINFARIYGAGLKKIAAMLGVSETEAKKVLKIYNTQVLPEANTLLNLASETARRRGYVMTLLGRRARFPGAARLHKALNSIIQGSAGDLMKIKLCEAYEERERIGLTMKITVHDELDGDVYDEESARLVKEVLNRQSMDLRIPILWSSSVAKHWAACDSKWKGGAAA